VSFHKEKDLLEEFKEKTRLFDFGLKNAFKGQKASFSSEEKPKETKKNSKKGFFSIFTNFLEILHFY